MKFISSIVLLALFSDQVPSSRNFDLDQEVQHPEDRNNNNACKYDNVLSSCQKLGAIATAFCSLYLGIKSTTVTNTVTPLSTTTTTLITTTITTTTLPPSCNSDSPQTTSDDEVTATSGDGPLRRRGGVAIPTALKKFAAAQISSACSCLSIKPRTNTATTTGPPRAVVSTARATTTSIFACRPASELCDTAIEDYKNCCSGGCYSTCQ